MTQVVGKPTPRVEGELKVTGKALYSADLQVTRYFMGQDACAVRFHTGGSNASIPARLGKCRG